MIAIIALLMEILISVLQKVKEQAQEISWTVSLRQYGNAETENLDDYNDRYPQSWITAVKTESPVIRYQNFCSWHNPIYPTNDSF